MTTANDRAVLEALFNPFGAEVPIETDNGDSEKDSWTPSKEEARAVALAEAGQYHEALQLLTDLLARPFISDEEKASLLNNRAQIFRLLGKLTEASLDLDAAIALGVNRRAQRQALTQKALLERLAGRVQEANDLLRQAAALGSRFARVQLDAQPTNPYAALCNQMLKKMFADLRGE